MDEDRGGCPPCPGFWDKCCPERIRQTYSHIDVAVSNVDANPRITVPCAFETSFLVMFFKVFLDGLCFDIFPLSVARIQVDRLFLHCTGFTVPEVVVCCLVFYIIGREVMV